MIWEEMSYNKYKNRNDEQFRFEYKLCYGLYEDLYKENTFSVEDAFEQKDYEE